MHPYAIFSTRAWTKAQAKLRVGGVSTRLLTASEVAQMLGLPTSCDLVLIVEGESLAVPWPPIVAPAVVVHGTRIRYFGIP
jgi:hypothetical protein